MSGMPGGGISKCGGVLDEDEDEVCLMILSRVSLSLSFFLGLRGADGWISSPSSLTKISPPARGQLFPSASPLSRLLEAFLAETPARLAAIEYERSLCPRGCSVE